MSSLERYIIREISKPLAAIVAILAALFACFSTARYLAQAVSESLGFATVGKLVLLKTVIALEVLVPVALYACVVMVLARMHRDQEITAMRSAGLGGLRVARAVLLLALPVALAVGLLSVTARPWAYAGSYLIDARAEAEINLDRMQPRRFYGSEDSGRVSWIAGRGGGLMNKVFLYRREGGRSEVIVAASARQAEVDPDRRTRLELFDGVLYRLPHDARDDSMVRFQRLVLFLQESEQVIGYKRKAASTAELLHSSAPRDVAELQWRLSRPLATVLLSLIAVPLSRGSPRQGKYERSVAAALAFAIYYNLSGLAQNWVEQGTIGPVPGVWWLHGLLAVTVLVLFRPELRGLRAAQPGVRTS